MLTALLCLQCSVIFYLSKDRASPKELEMAGVYFFFNIELK